MESSASWIPHIGGKEDFLLCGPLSGSPKNNLLISTGKTILDFTATLRYFLHSEVLPEILRYLKIECNKPQ